MLGLFRKKKREMPLIFQELAEYNTNKMKGIMYSKETQQRMEKLQKAYNKGVKGI